MLCTAVAQAADTNFGPEQERILEVTVGKYHFEDVLLCYQEGELLFVPLGQLAQLIDLSVKTSPVSAHAEGFVFRESNTFMLDVEQRLVVVGGVAQPLDPQRVRVAIDDIYVDATLVQSWFGFSLEPNLLNSQLIIRSKTPLPFEERLKREERSSKLAGHTTARLPNYPRREESYHLWEMPFIDQTLRVGQMRDIEGQHSATHAYTTYGSGDLLWMDSSWYLSGTQEESPDVARLTLSRKDPEGRVLAPLGLTELSFGHVFAPRVALINLPGRAEPGVLFGNAPLFRAATFDTHTFVGDLEPGWEVELYHNNVLLGYQTPNSDGQYQFADVPLVYGSNNFRLVFYGPQGQRLEQTQHFEIGHNQLPAGEQNYRVMVSQDKLGGSRTVIDYNAGLHSNLSFNGNLVSLPLVELDNSIRQHNYLHAGVNSTLGKAVMSLGVIDDMQSGSAIDWRIQGRVDSSVLGLSHSYLNDFVSEEFPVNQANLASRSQLRLDSVIPSSDWSPLLPLSLELERDRYRDSTENRRANFRLSMQRYKFSASNLLSWSRFNNAEAITTGALQTAFRTSNFSLRAIYQYSLAPAVHTTSMTLAGDITNFHQYNLNAGLTHTMALKQTHLTAGANRDFGNFTGLVALRYGNQGDYLVEMGVSFSLGRNPRNGDWTMRTQSMARYGAIAPRVFLDENGNGQQDPHELPLSDVAFQFNGVHRPQTTDPQGDALITNALPYQPLAVSIDSRSLADPAYYSATEGVTLVNRPGHVTQLDFPVVMTGEVDGVVSLIKEGGRVNVGGVEVELVDRDGLVIQRTKSAYDGFYLFSKIPAGAYQVRIAPEQTARLGLATPEPQAVELHAQQWFASNIDFQLEIGPTRGE